MSIKQIHTHLWEILKTIQDARVDNLDMSSVADLMDGRLVHTLFTLVLKQRSSESEGLCDDIDFIDFYLSEYK